MKFPTELQSINDAPHGYHWAYRGTHWTNGGKECHYAYYPKCGGWNYVSSDKLHVPNGEYGHYAELVKGEPSPLSLEEQITFARSIVGKTYQYRESAVSNITEFGVAVERDTKLSSLVNNETDDKGFCVYIRDHKNCTIPVMHPNFKEVTFKEVKLNSQYSAKVYKDKIVVGCQEFPITILDELNGAYSKL